MDFTWPDGLAGDTVLDGRARDLRTNGDGTATVLAEASLRMVTDPRRIIKEIGSAPGCRGLREPGRRVGHVRLPAAAGRDRGGRDAGGTPLYQLLDDVPGATLVSGAAWQRWYDMDVYLELKADVSQRVMTDVCTGYQQGSSALQPDGTLRWRQDRQPAVDIDAVDDDLAWHPHAAPRGGDDAARPPDRRVGGRPGDPRRRVLPGLLDAARGRAAVDPRVHADRAGRPGNGDGARGDPGARGCCPTTSARWPSRNVAALAGLPLGELRGAVLERLRGPLGCTHLNDMLRALADVPALARQLPAAPGT